MESAQCADAVNRKGLELPRFGERRYRYQVSRNLTAGTQDSVRTGWRLPGPVARGRQWADELLTDRVESVAAIAKREGVLPN